MRKLFLFFGCFIFCGIASAQSSDEPKVEPEGNDFTVGTRITPRGHIQVESVFSDAHRGFEREIRIGETLARVPLTDNIEVQATFPAYLVQSDLARRSGLDDARLGARVHLKSGGKADFALNLDSTLPTGSRRVAERRYQPQAVVAASFALSPRAELDFNAGIARPTSNGERFTQGLAAAELNFDVTPKLAAFLEIYGQSRDEAGGDAQKFAAGGFVYRFNDRNALYGNAAFGLGNDIGGPDRSFLLGLARLF